MTSASSPQSGFHRDVSMILSRRLSGGSQKIALVLWGLVTFICLVSLTLSIYSLNLWDRTPAAEAPQYFRDMTPESVQNLTEWQNTVLEAGLSLSGYAFIFTAARFIGGLSLFVVSFLLIRHNSDRLIAVLMATLLSVFAAAGIWYNLLFGWAVSIAPWMDIPVQILGLIMWWGGAIAIFTFPNGRFVPRWTVWLVVLIIPLGFLLVIDIDFFLNPNNWPAPLHLLPNILLLGGALFSVIYRYLLTVEPSRKRALRSYVLGISLLIVVYFINLSLEIYSSITGQSVFQNNRAALTYVMVNEPVWFVLEVLFAVGLALSVFRYKLLEEQAY